METFIVRIVYIHLEQIMHLKKHERLCDNNDYCNVEMSTQCNKTLKYNYGEKSLKTPFVIYADLEYISLKQQSCQNNPNESYTERKAIHALCLVSSFDSKQKVLKGFVVI